MEEKDSLMKGRETEEDMKGRKGKEVLELTRMPQKRVMQERKSGDKGRRREQMQGW